MPASGERERSNRKGQYSCNFCRSRKLRCDRPLPCTSCRSRGKTCQFDPTPAARKAQGPHTPVSVGVTPKPQQPQDIVQTPSSLSGKYELLAETSALQMYAQELEERIIQKTTSFQQAGADNSKVFRSGFMSGSARDDANLDQLSNMHEMSAVVGHLEGVSMSRSSLELFAANCVIFKIRHIRAIPSEPSYLMQLGRPTPCIWLPLRKEAMTLLDYYITELNYIQHVTHYPSLPLAFDEVYRQIESCEPVQPSKVILLLSIIAHVTHVWTPPNGLNSEPPLFMSSSQAQSQTPMWIKATYTVLDAIREGYSLALETVQGIIILSYVICNIEGVSLRYRSLISTGLLLGRELDLHRVDHASTADAAGTLKAEIGRRVWWYLTATDWLLAARYGGPGEGVYQSSPLHMNVNKPLNINDVDLLVAGHQPSLPSSQHTDVSYFLQRIHLAEISRTLVDHISADPSNRDAHVMAMDSELMEMMHEIPAFFLFDNHNEPISSDKPNHLFIQAYFLNTLIHTQRCKLHLTSFTHPFMTGSTKGASRAACLHSAHQLLHLETKLLQSHHPFARRPQRPPAGLYSIFIATIALIMDTCLNRPSELQAELQQYGDLAKGLEMIANAREDSLAAAKLYESLMQIVARYRDTGYTGEKSGNGLENQTIVEIALPGFPSSALHEHASSSHIDDAIHLDMVDWDDLFSSVSSSPFF